MENVYLLRGIISIPASLFKRGGHFVADGAKNGLQGEDSLESAGCGSWPCGLSGRINEEPEWCFVRCLQFSQNLEELAHAVRPGHTDILVMEHEEIAIPRPGLYPPKFI
jgi:hypothetical protein